MKILIAATPLTGHVNPLLAVGRAAAARGDDVLVLSDPLFRETIEAAGLRFTAYADNGSATFRETGLPAGPERYRREFQRRFIDPMPGQAEVLRGLIADEAPDVIVAGSLFLGVLPLLLDAAPRPPIPASHRSRHHRRRERRRRPPVDRHVRAARCSSCCHAADDSRT